MTDLADGRIGPEEARSKRSAQEGDGTTPTFTVFTPTYNRGHVLHRVYDSLVGQTFQDFEWLVIDNVSTDKTAELMERWIAESPFPIRYLRNEINVGRQGSWRRAIGEARGRFFTETRSADSLLPRALERLKYHWDSIPDEMRANFSAVSALAQDEHGKLIGTPFPREILDSDSIEVRYRYRVRGDKFGFQRTDVLRTVRIPLITGYTGEIPARIVWRAIARRYKTRYVNERLRVYWQDQGPGLSRPSVPWINAPGRFLDAQDLLTHDMRWLPVVPFTFLREAAAYVCSAWHAGKGPAAQARGLPRGLARALWLAAFPIGTAIFAVQRLFPALGRRLPNP